MSTSKHIDKICIAVIAIVLIITIGFMSLYKPSLTGKGKTIGYEDHLFSSDKVHSIDIIIDDWDGFIENCESEEYSPCTLLIDGEKFGNVGLRGKGNTSLRNVRSMGSQRYSLKVEFDHYEDGKTYHGLDKLCLNNLIQDNTMMKDYLTYRMMADFGADAPLCSYAYIKVNGEDWGLYLAVEGVEDSFLERNYGSKSGELYKPDSMDFGGGPGNGRNFDPEKMQDFAREGNQRQNNTKEGERPQKPDFKEGERLQKPDFKEGERPQKPDFPGEEGDSKQPGRSGGMGQDDVKLKYIDDDPDSYSNIFDNAKTDISDKDKEKLIQSLKKLNEYTDLEDTLEKDEVLRYFVVHNFVVNGDSYTGSMIHNYYLHEKEGKLSMIPWDYNLAFGTFQGRDASESINAPVDGLVSGSDVDDRPMFGWILSDETYTGEYHKLYSEFIEEWIDGGKLEKMINDTADMIRPYVEKDPTKFCTAEEFEKGAETMKKYVALRGKAVKSQLDGDSTPVDADDLNISDMGTMNNGREGNQHDGEERKKIQRD